MERVRLIIRLALAVGMVTIFFMNGWDRVWAQSQSDFTDPWMDTFYVKTGDTFNVPIYFGTNFPVRSAQFNIRFNPAVLRLNSLSEGGFFSGYAQTIGGTVNVAPAVMDQQAGTTSGFNITLNAPAGMGPVGVGVLAVLNFTALTTGKSQTNLESLVILDKYSNPQPNLITTGGVVWVGPPPQLVIDSLQLVPQGIGADFGKTFGVRFTVKNIGGLPSDPTYAFISAVGAIAPSPFPNLTIPALASGQTLVLQVDGYLVGTSLVVVSVGVAGDSTREATYQSNLATSSAETQIDASIGAVMKISPDLSIQMGELKLGPNIFSGSIYIWCNTSYLVEVSDTNPLTAWHLRQFDGTAYLDHLLTDPLIIQADGFPAVSYPGGILLSGTLSGQAAQNRGQTFGLRYFQSANYSDMKLPPGQTYHLILNFNGFVIQ